jgi:hypothetical protein
MRASRDGPMVAECVLCEVGAGSGGGERRKAARLMPPPQIPPLTAPRAPDATDTALPPGQHAPLLCCTSQRSLPARQSASRRRRGLRFSQAERLAASSEHASSLAARRPVRRWRLGRDHVRRQPVPGAAYFRAPAAAAAIAAAPAVRRPPRDAVQLTSHAQWVANTLDWREEQRCGMCATGASWCVWCEGAIMVGTLPCLGETFTCRPCRA